MPRFARWIAGLASKGSPPPDVECEAGQLVPYDPTTTDDIGDEINVPRRRGESCRAYRFRMQLFLQEELLRRQRYEVLLDRLLEADRRA
jgi:hypothetical protein